jgi:hypothetical protein
VPIGVGRDYSALISDGETPLFVLSTQCDFRSKEKEAMENIASVMFNSLLTASSKEELLSMRHQALPYKSWQGQHQPAHNSYINSALAEKYEFRMHILQFSGLVSMQTFH